MIAMIVLIAMIVEIVLIHVIVLILVIIMILVIVVILVTVVIVMKNLHLALLTKISAGQPPPWIPWQNSPFAPRMVDLSGFAPFVG